MWRRPFVMILYFNPRSREGSDLSLAVVYAVVEISIHAPVKGATRIPSLNFDGAYHFNPRSREGSNHRLAAPTHQRRISIHAPVKGATILVMYLFLSLMISIHAPVKGATISVVRVDKVRGHFNPRSREGSDAARAAPGGRRGDFNPRSREGSDRLLLIVIPKRVFISIHAPVKGATDPQIVCIHILQISIHAPVKGATRSIGKPNFTIVISIHAPVKGATRPGRLVGAFL